MKYVFFLLLTAALAGAQAFTCPAGSEDMLNYFVMAYPARTTAFMGPGNANPVYTTMQPDLGAEFAEQGIFFWTKSVAGYPWDVKTYDAKYIYDRATELNWNDPTSFKRFTTDMPMSRRCVKIGKSGGAVKLSVSQTQYGFYSNCQLTQTAQLSYALNTISPPTLLTVGNVGSVTTRLFRYRYNCDSNYSNCGDMEVFSLGYGVGLYDWKHYVNQNGKWVKKQESVINNFQSGQTAPSLPCSNSYQ